MKLIDTGIAIDHFHGHRVALEYFAEHLSTGEVLSISAVGINALQKTAQFPKGFNRYQFDSVFIADNLEFLSRP